MIHWGQKKVIDKGNTGLMLAFSSNCKKTEFKREHWRFGHLKFMIELHDNIQRRISQQTFVGLEDVFKTCSRHVLKMSSTRLQRNNFTSFKTSSRCLGRRKLVTLKTSWRRLQDMSWRRLEDKSWRRLEDMSWRCLEDISWRCLQDMSWRRLEDFMETNKILTGDICIRIWG